MNSNLEKLWAFVTDVATGKWYWVLLAVLGIFMEAVALYWQYGLGDEPCQICIHIRIWVAAFTVLALLMCVLPGGRWVNTGGHLLAVGCMIGLMERTKYLWDVERGLGEGSCEFFLGFPDWFALDRWFPAMFEVRNLCGFTPEMLFGLSMAQMLMVASPLLLVMAVFALALTVHKGFFQG